MIIGEIRGQQTSQMALAEDDYMVQTLAPDGSDQPLRVRILPRAERTRNDLTDTDAGDAASERVTIDSIAIPQQPFRRGIVGKSFNNLLRGPFCLG